MEVDTRLGGDAVCHAMGRSVEVIIIEGSDHDAIQEIFLTALIHGKALVVALLGCGNVEGGKRDFLLRVLGDMLAVPIAPECCVGGRVY